MVVVVVVYSEKQVFSALKSCSQSSNFTALLASSGAGHVCYLGDNIVIYMHCSMDEALLFKLERKGL
jgi:hypothetical protein